MSDLQEEVRQFLMAQHLRLNTNLGQHFLIDESVLKSILEAANVQTTDAVVEIGPGIGVLTRELVQRAGKVIAIELDERMLPLLTAFIANCQLPIALNQSKSSKLTILNENALHTTYPTEPYKIVANIPYHITSPLLRRVFLESHRAPSSLTLLIQREVAEKICSETDAGMLTILVRLFGAPRIVTNVPPSSFIPPPKVDSAVLHIDCFPEPKASPDVIEEIFKLTKLAFSQKRKMLSNTIGSLPNGMELLAMASIDPKRRPQTLSIEEWIALAEQVKQ